MAVACGGGKPPPKTADSAPKAADPSHAEVHERVVPHTCGSRTKIAQLLGRTTPAATAPVDQAGPATDAAPPSTSLGATAKLAGNQAYRLVAPGTVLVRTEHGMGTGVVIDERGYVLTNYHVVADGEQKDFIVTVSVTFGDMTPTGRMSRQEKTYDAVVVKADPVRDMAIVKIKDPPAKVPTVKLAKNAPQVAEKVIAVGHAGIGFLWAAKTCSVASIGERQQDASILAGYDCTRADPAATPEVAAKAKKLCDEQKKMVTEAFLAKTQGLAVQTDCAITHGDSGGPLVNAAGEIVGLNQSISADLATASFHVHLDEIRDFTAKFPEEGVPVLPDPYCDGGFNATLEDIDLDGIPDTVVMKGGSGLFGGYDRMGILIDLDQDHFKKMKDKLDQFDAEIALLMVRDTAYIWYDTDGDSKFDLLLVDKGNDGHPDLAYRIDTEGRIKEDKEALPKHDLSGKYVKDASLHARLGKIGAAIGGEKYVSTRTLAAAANAVTIPDALLGAGTQGRLVDSDGDGKPDLVFVRGTFSHGLLVDADQDSIGSLKPGDSAEDLLKERKVDAEISVIIQGSTVWAIYDTNNDGKFDLALRSADGGDESFLYVTKAFTLGGPGEMTPAPAQIGRKLIRPGLVSIPRAFAAFRSSNMDVASDEGAGSLPDPTLSPRGGFHFREVKGFPKGTVIEASSGSATTTLIDLDHDSKLDPKATDPQKAVADKKFDAEIAVVHRSGADWIYYDTDNDGKFDLVLYVPASGQEVTQAFRLTKDASLKSGMALEIDAKSAVGRPIRTKSVFNAKAMNARFKPLAGKLFKATSIED